MQTQGDTRIGDWTVTQLIQFITAQREENPPIKAGNFTCDDFTAFVSTKLVDKVQLYQYQNTVGAAGSAQALPATPLGYFKLLDRNGTNVVIPYYTA